jgi:hypothetical protein
MLPRREVVRALAEEQSRTLTEAARAAANVPLDDRARQDLMLQLTETAADNWDAAAQRFLACAAVNFSMQAAAAETGDAAPRESATIDDALRRIRELLEFDDGGDGPQYDSPKNESTDRRSAVREAFEEIHRAASELPAP